MESAPLHIQTFRALFKGREDVFAVRWEKGTKNGYTPAYDYDPYRYRVHKAGGGSFQSFHDKTFRPLSETEITKHLEGQQQIGLYPMLTDHTSWLLVADFDKTDWQLDAMKFLEACSTQGIPAYLERSRSGNGGHVWIFFDRPYPAVRSRKLFIHILEQCSAFSRFDKGSSFDRLFPNQDRLSGKGLGNLIALPLFKSNLSAGNSCFLDTETLTPIEDQFTFLSTIKRVAVTALNVLLGNLTTSESANSTSANFQKLSITLENTVRLNQTSIPQALTSFLKEELNFVNSAYIVKKNSGKSTFDTPRFFNLIKEKKEEIVLPRGFIGKLIRFCREKQIEHELVDKRVTLANVPLPFQAKLRKHQQ